MNDGAMQPANAATPVRVLIVEDDIFFRRALTDYLSLEGYEVLSAGGVDELAPILSGTLPDLILCDIALPGQSGLEILKSIRANPITKDVPVLMLTAAAERSVMREAMQDGADDYITKPVTAGEILAAIRARLLRLSGRIGSKLTVPEGSGAAGVTMSGSNSSDGKQPHTNLSPREIDVLRGLVRGSSNSEIGEALGIAESTVKRHLLKVFLKLGVPSRTAAVVHCLGNTDLRALVNTPIQKITTPAAAPAA
jgi:two-component system nitrate/nitrite response regulator NarL